MKTILTILISFILLACESKNSQVTIEKSVDSTFSDSLKSKSQFVNLCSKKNSFPLLQDVYLDSLIIEDSLLNLTVEIIIPKSTDVKSKTADSLVSKRISEWKNNFIKSISYHPDMLKAAAGNYFSVYPEQLYKSETAISYLLVKETHYSGGAHSKIDYYAFNYDLKKGREIKFSDLFTFKDKVQQDSLIKWLNQKLNDDNVKVDSFYNYKFNFTNEQITFNFSDYEVASYAYGTQRVTFAKKELARYIKEDVK